jgi:hypothetical protein
MLTHPGDIVRSLNCTVSALLLFVSTPLLGQAPRWAIRGDTAGAPSGCSAAAAIRAIDEWFTAFNRADSAGLAAVSATEVSANHGFVVSTGRFTRAESFVRIESSRALLAYVRERARHHERLTLDSVRFYGWVHGGGRAMGFMPFYVRAADDLGPKPLHGVGKASYFCGEGIHVLNLAPRPDVMGGP